MRTLIGIILLVLVASPPFTVAQEGLSKEQIIEALRQKVQATTPPPEAKRIETVAQFTLRIRGRETCSFEGTLIQEGERRELRTNELRAECAQFREQISTVFLSSAQISAVLLSNYGYELIGEQVVSGDRQYKIRAHARDPRENLYLMEVWISSETGLIPEGLLYIRKPKTAPIRIVQTYYQEDGRWLLRSVRASTSFYVLIFIRIGVEIDIDVRSTRYFF